MTRYRILSLCAAFLAAQTAGAAVTEVPVLKTGVGGGAGAAGAMTGSQGTLNSPINLSLPTLNGTHLPSAASPTPLTESGGISPTSGFSAPKTGKAAAAPNAVFKAPATLPSRIQPVKSRKGATEDGKLSPETPAVGSEGFRRSLKSVGEDTGGIRKTLGKEEGEGGGEKSSGIGSKMFDGGKVRDAEAPAVTAQEPTLEEKAARSFLSYVRSISGGLKLRPDQYRGLFDMWLEERNINPNSRIARSVEARFFPKATAAMDARLAKVHPRFKHFARTLVVESEKYGVPVERAQAAIARHGLTGTLVGERKESVIKRILGDILHREQVEGVVEDYPENRQGRFMRSMAQDILVKSGKSVEEVSRAGAFGYVDFNGGTVSRFSTGRDPDNQSAHVVFYVTLSHGKWDIQGYRQNRVRGHAGGSDAQYVEALKKWLISGGIPAEALK